MTKNDLRHLILAECDKHIICDFCKFNKLSTCTVNKMTEQDMLIAEQITNKGINNEKTKD